MRSCVRQLAAIAAVMVFAVGANADDWVPVTGANGTFHFLAPAQPEAKTTNATDNGVPYTITTCVSKNAGLIEVGAFSDYGNANAELDINLVVGGFVKGLGATLISNDPMPYTRGPNDTLTGAMVAAKAPNATCHMRLAVDGLRSYGLAVCSYAGQDVTADMDRALASFQITK